MALKEKMGPLKLILMENLKNSFWIQKVYILAGGITL